jgi:oligopeptide/dipeptide ABC transporter ATP-binding protein
MTALLEVRNLTRDYPARDRGGVVRAVNEVSFVLAAGQTLGIVGESGCGKSTLARLIMRLIEPTAGEIFFSGENLLTLPASELRRRRRDIQMVFQDPYASLDPRMNVAAIISEPLEIHRIGSRAARQAKVRELLDLVGLDRSAGGKFPHEFSGGQRQRIGIARAIALEPKLVVLDEPVSALDVSIQSQILNLLEDLKARLGLSYIFISHDLSVIEHASDEVAVMYLGKFVEVGKAEQVLHAPLHPYAQALVSAVPALDATRKKQRIVLAGNPPNPENIPAGCPFHPRCHYAMPKCQNQVPALDRVEARRVACHLYT